MSSIPLTAFRGHLKFQRPTTLNALGRAALTFACPHFLELATPTVDMLTAAKRIASPKLNYLVFDLRNQRRYAGDHSLPRSCYFSVCRTAMDDSGTLERELRAYADPVATGSSLIFDLGIQSRCESIGLSGPARPAIAIVFPRNGRAAKSFCDAHGDLISHQADASICIEIPYDIQNVNIERVLDLRLPSTQTWLFDIFRMGDGVILQKPNGAAITNFQQMLPTLLTPEHGGNAVTNALGAYFRINNVNALIFPSARSNAQTFIQDGRLLDASGFNLVDYRKSNAPPDFKSYFDLSPWETKSVANLTVRSAPAGRHAGSLAIQGIDEWHQSEFTRALATTY